MVEPILNASTTETLRILWHDMADRATFDDGRPNEPARDAMRAIEDALIEDSPGRVYIRPLTWRGVAGWHLSGTLDPERPNEVCYFAHTRAGAERSRRSLLAGVGPIVLGGAPDGVAPSTLGGTDV